MVTQDPAGEDNSRYTEQEVAEAVLGLKFPVVTKEYAESLIERVHYDILSDRTTTVCTLMLFDKTFSVRGESSSMDARNFDPKIGRTHAYNDAFRELMKIVAAVTCFNNALVRRGDASHMLEAMRRIVDDDYHAIQEVGLTDNDGYVLPYLISYRKLLNGETL